MRFSRYLPLLPVGILFLPAGLLPAIMPPQPAKLAIYSDPPGAIVTINGQQMQQRTDAAFTVSPGRYQIFVESVSPRFSCPTKAVDVASGQTVSLKCTASGWK